MADAVTGAAAGLAASFLMNTFQTAWAKVSHTLKSGSDHEADSRSGDNDEADPPATVKAAQKVYGTVACGPLPEAKRETAGSLVHYGFGAVLGAIYGAVSRGNPSIRSGYGTVYGAGVSIVADEVLVPATGLSPPPAKSPASSHIFGLISHIVFGAALEGSRRLIKRAAG
ncbi:DUF1440 domain-containing protein [Allopontixanthobacter sp.]|uniref:DUF1440 domain-containing protein n=1 Tax=Allopontixanthobacter sp. TaxID=2906452 RepID=UPI002AC9B575|nr:DUF1440 domain-containing protein [Allopontixanthobacter sp.]